MIAPAFIEQFSQLAPDYDAVLCDVWGVIHNGLAAFPEACEALTRFRADGGAVVLITNAPRPMMSGRSSVQCLFSQTVRLPTQRLPRIGAPRSKPLWLVRLIQT